MVPFSLGMTSLGIFISAIGFLGNIFLILFIAQNKFFRLKSFELFLLGLAVSNLEEILVVDIYEIIIFHNASLLEHWSCQTLKFLTAFGETASILFTVLISIFRYQKLRDAEKRVNFPIFLDSVRSAWMMSGVCMLLAMIISVPIYVMNIQGQEEVNSTLNVIGCPPDFFQCHVDSCPLLNKLYKYVFLLACNLLPLLIVTVTSCLIIRVLVNQKMVVAPVPSAGALGHSSAKSKGPKIQRSTVAVLTAMAVFQLDWTLYLLLHLAVNPYEIPSWPYLQFFISTSYTTISPYVYGIGNNMFTLKKFMRR